MINLLRVFVVLCVALGFAQPVLSQPKEQRVALVIGNSAYKSSPLRNPVNDARDMATKLRSLGFTVIERSNLGMKQIGGTLREFRAKLTPGSVALVFYAGHGLQIRGENYLPAVDAEISGEEDVPNQSLAVRQIMDVLSDAKTRLNLVFLDACRDNPYARNFRTTSKGLSKENAPSGTLISFATRPGSVAADGAGRNGLYTGALLAAMDDPSRHIEQILKSVVTAVKAGSRNAQEPWMEGIIEGDFCFGACGRVMTAGAGIPEMSASQLEEKFWDDAKAVGNKEALDAYLLKYPQGRYMFLAKAYLARLETGQLASAAAQATFTRPSPVPGSVFKDCDDCPEMVVIPAGSFEMGSADGGADERPVHAVTVSGFAMGRTEVTQGQWRAVMGSNPSFFKDCGDACPVENISWQDAQTFATKLSIKTGKTYRLPSEAQWEYAARAGGTGRWCVGNDDSQLADYAWFGGGWSDANGVNKTKPVGTKKANAFGLHDMHGNVWEWVQDVWHENYHGAPIDGSAWVNGGDQARRVLRGGAWNGNSRSLRSANRIRSEPGGGGDTGIRIARTN